MFRIYDKEGQGFITNDVLKEILREIDSSLTEDDLDNIIEEVDEVSEEGKGPVIINPLTYHHTTLSMLMFAGWVGHDGLR